MYLRYLTVYWKFSLETYTEPSNDDNCEIDRHRFCYPQTDDVEGKWKL